MTQQNSTVAILVNLWPLGIARKCGKTEIHFTREGLVRE
jgi:hypothetical protein